MASINDLREPIEVYEAVVGNKGPLIEYLRSERPMGSWMRDALAAYLAGELEPKLPRGRPAKASKSAKLMHMAVMDYRCRVYWMKKQGQSTYGKSEAIRAEVAESYGLIPEQFEQECHRGIPPCKSAVGLQARFVNWYLNTHKK